MSERVLICGLNWLGDAVMSMPAVQLYKRRNPDTDVAMLVKAPVADLWSLSRAVDRVLVYDGRTRGTFAAARRVREGHVTKAFVFPNSFRSALIPFLAGVPERIGARGRQRACLLTQTVDAPRGGTVHQSGEYIRILQLEPPGEVEAPVLELPGSLVAETRKHLATGPQAASRVALIPGAARGPAKRWPPGFFVEVGKALAAQGGHRLLVLGAPSERALCAQVAAGIGPAALDLAGRTSIPQLAAVLSDCRAAVTNDSGGMHLAAAAGTRVVAIYGLTDPATTGPLGAGHRIVARPGVNGSRDIGRESEASRACLESISPGAVLTAVQGILHE